MPLAPERDLFPDGLFGPDFPRELAPGGPGGRWWLAHTKPRQEKALARHLSARRFPFYLPCRSYRRKSGRRILTSTLPIFPGYLFVWVTEAERLATLAAAALARLAAVPDQGRLWDDLAGVRRVLDLGLPVTPVDRLPPGTRVAVRTGPLAGATGVVVREASRRTFVIRVDLIGRGLAVVVDAATLGKLDG